MFSIIVPAYNEAGRISRPLSGLAEYFPEAEIIVAADGCTDGTEDVVIDIAKRYDNIRLVSSGRRLGKGGGLMSGFLASKGNDVIFADADGSCSPSEIARLASMLKDYDVVIGSRSVSSKVIAPQPFHRFVLATMFYYIVKLMFRLPVHDSQCGYKAFRRKALEGNFGRVASLGFEYDVELLYRLKKAGFSIREEPVVWSDVRGTKVGPLDPVRMLFGLLGLRIRLLKEKLS